jgi:uncharacterized protein YjeT (DUF2065 family)
VDWQNLITALALVLILEGAVIAVFTGGWRQAMSKTLTQSDEMIRTTGLVVFLVGAGLLWFIA